MQKLKNKLHGARGETLVEVLIAMLIAALATMLLAAMVHAAGEINITTRERDEHYYAELTAAETLTELDDGYGDVRPESGKTYQVTVHRWTANWAAENSAITTSPIDVNPFGGDHLTAYRKKTT